MASTASGGKMKSLNFQSAWKWLYLCLSCESQLLTYHEFVDALNCAHFFYVNCLLTDSNKSFSQFHIKVFSAHNIQYFFLFFFFFFVSFVNHSKHVHNTLSGYNNKWKRTCYVFIFKSATNRVVFLLSPWLGVNFNVSIDTVFFLLQIFQNGGVFWCLQSHGRQWSDRIDGSYWRGNIVCNNL